jgi:hypothetical protein
VCLGAKKASKELIKRISKNCCVCFEEQTEVRNVKYTCAVMKGPPAVPLGRTILGKSMSVQANFLAANPEIADQEADLLNDVGRFSGVKIVMSPIPSL